MVSSNAGATAMFSTETSLPPARVFQRFPPLAVHHAAGVAPPPVQLGPGLQIRAVTAANMDLELDAIASLLTTYTYIFVDAEYAGVVHRPPPSTTRLALAPHERYALVKSNVDEVPIVQLGITLSNAHGNVPVVVDGHGRPFELAWEVTFSDFDARRDRHATDSVAFLRSQGVDFDHARSNGVSSAAFAAKLAAVLSATPNRDELTWAAFGGAHDFAYVVKMLSEGRPLPETWHAFMVQAKALLGGGRVFDAKYMAEHCERADLCGGGLRRVAACLGVRRNFPGLPYLAAQKSHTACLVYTVMRRHVLDRDGGDLLQGLIDGLQW